MPTNTPNQSKVSIPKQIVQKIKTPSNPSKQNIDNPIIELNNNVLKLIKLLKRTNSFQYRFVSGIFTGFGTVIGATVVVSVVIFLWSWFSSQFNISSPIVDEIISTIDSTKPTSTENIKNQDE